MNSSPIEAAGWAHRGRSLSGAGLAILSMCCVQFGAALSQALVDRLGVFGATAWRLAIAAVMLSLWRRPKLSRLPRGAWLVTLLLGAAMAGMLMGFFAAIRTLPQGLAAAINLLGPLWLAWRADTRPRRGLWPLLALLGILALARHGERWTVDMAGLAWAAMGAACWAAYIILLRRAGEVCQGCDGVALALPFAGLLAAPFCWLGGAPAPGELAQLAGLSLLMPVLPYLLELAALRRLNPAPFGVLMSLEPAVAVLAGAVLLGQALAPWQLAGLAMVTAASLGAMAET
ncbi:DMT family transporter [Chromobacterium sp. IIBBL 290-4]|uniref:EamA family transporter n=1 Tax=Chromobacterium sp. IIBBL 290-4 TaxID=2953890 RepID=UPI0020B834D0|nr:EamA family transporter [Chromobacterium sp. IIBBL 290-4]UTH72892.1 EamA family transporter [Chromobacterium sp. IIBBL 290-4]